MNDNHILNHFDFDPEFKKRSDHWEADLKNLFSRLAQAIHNTGLDIYLLKRGTEVRFGCKRHGNKDASSVAGCISVAKNKLQIKGRRAWEGKNFRSIKHNDTWLPLDAQLASNFTKELKNWNGIPEKYMEDH